MSSLDQKIVAVYVFEQLPPELKVKNGIKTNLKNPRFDLLTQYDNGCEFIKPLVNNKNQVNITLIPPRNLVKANAQRMADFLVKSNRVGNVTSLWYSATDNANRFWGYTNPNPELKGGAANPMSRYHNDLLLIDLSEDSQRLTMTVMEGYKHYAPNLYPRFVRGDFDDLIAKKLEFGESPYSYTL